MADLIRWTNAFQATPWTRAHPLGHKQAARLTGGDEPGAAAITRAASLQTYATVRLLVDRPLIPAAYQAYAYFRWVDDCLDQGGLAPSERITFLDRQIALMEACYRGHRPRPAVPEENMLVELIRGDRQAGSGLQIYIRHMMAVMEIDTHRRGRLIRGLELDRYTWLLASAVTEALHYFIGHKDPSPRGEMRYMAATGAHLTHMLRDTHEDLRAGYYNIPCEVLAAHDLSPWEVDHPAYRAWVQERVVLARRCFTAGKSYLAKVANPRTRLAGCSYIARFEGVLAAIEREEYLLRANYGDCKGPQIWIRSLRLAISLPKFSQTAQPSSEIPAVG